MLRCLQASQQPFMPFQDPYMSKMQNALLRFQQSFGDTNVASEEIALSSMPGVPSGLPKYLSLHPLESIKLAGDLPAELCFLSVMVEHKDGGTEVISVQTANPVAKAVQALHGRQHDEALGTIPKAPSPTPQERQAEMMYDMRWKTSEAAQLFKGLDDDVDSVTSEVSEHSAFDPTMDSADVHELRQRMETEAQQLLAELKRKQSSAIQRLRTRTQEDTQVATAQETAEVAAAGSPPASPPMVAQSPPAAA